ncbi:MAG: hypothetical protein MAG451_02237 [Anaerolineales bacterium]|nr:hypothetical protein [Anaerolineales bacterium]
MSWARSPQPRAAPMPPTSRSGDLDEHIGDLDEHIGDLDEHIGDLDEHIGDLRRA